MHLLFTTFRYGGNAKVVHFLGKTKPWSYTFDPRGKQIAGDVQEATTHPSFLLDWWTLYSSAVVPMLQEQYGDQPFHSGCVEVNEHVCRFAATAFIYTWIQCSWWESCLKVWSWLYFLDLSAKCHNWLSHIYYYCRWCMSFLSPLSREVAEQWLTHFWEWTGTVWIQARGVVMGSWATVK